MSLIAERWKAQRLKMKRHGSPCSQTEFARLLGVSTSYLSLLESGQRTKPSVDLIRKAAEVTGRSFRFMAGE